MVNTDGSFAALVMVPQVRQGARVPTRGPRVLVLAAAEGGVLAPAAVLLLAPPGGHPTNQR